MSDTVAVQINCGECFVPEFWGVVLPPGESVDIDCPDYAYLVVTSACLPKVDDNTKISRVKAVLKNIPVLECYPTDSEEKPTGKVEESKNDVEAERLICTLIPKVKEYQKLEVVLSPLNYGYFKNTGNSEVHLAGILSPITDPFVEEEEEEEAKEHAETSEK